MTVLDQYFPRESTAASPALVARQTNWPEAEEPIRATLDCLDRLQGGTPRSPQVRKARRSAAREWVAEFGEGRLDLLERTFNHLRSKKLTVVTERSLIKTALQFKYQEAGGTWADYLCPECQCRPCTCEEA